MDQRGNGSRGVNNRRPAKTAQASNEKKTLS